MSEYDTGTQHRTNFTEHLRYSLCAGLQMKILRCRTTSLLPRKYYRLTRYSASSQKYLTFNGTSARRTLTFRGNVRYRLFGRELKMAELMIYNCSGSQRCGKFLTINCWRKLYKPSFNWEISNVYAKTNGSYIYKMNSKTSSGGKLI